LVQPHQEVLPGHLRRRDPGRQLPSAEAAVPLLDGADRRIHRPDHAEPIAQLSLPAIVSADRPRSYRKGTVLVASHGLTAAGPYRL